MFRILILLIAGAATGCTHTTGAGSTEPAQSGQLLTFDCGQDWSKCARQAMKACGPRGYEELDRFSDSDMTAAGRVVMSGEGDTIYREDARIEERNRVLAVRCN